MVRWIVTTVAAAGTLVLAPHVQNVAFATEAGGRGAAVDVSKGKIEAPAHVSIPYLVWPRSTLGCVSLTLFVPFVS